MRKITKKRSAALVDLTVEAMTFGAPADEQPDGPSFDNWRWHLDDRGAAWALLDKKGASTNTLSEDVLVEFNDLLGVLEALRPKGLIIRSAKPNGFIAGAEISDFRNMTDAGAAADRIRQGLEVLDRLERFPAPTIALIHGFCLGGGLELALACRYRIGRDDAKLGFPEVMLGLHPGLAGTWRSLKVMTPIEAMTLMLTGRTSHARKAKRQGLLDTVAPERHLAAAVDFTLGGKLKTRRPCDGLTAKLLRSTPGRAASAWQMRRETAKKAKPEHYPAPFDLIDLWQEHGGNPKAMRAAETRSFAKLLTGDTAQGRVRVCFLREALKEHGKRTDHGVAHVHVIGAGLMGGDIAAWAALRGYRVTVQDREAKYIAPAIKRAAKLFDRKLHRPGEQRAALDRLIPDLAGDGIARADLIIEAVPEDEAIKHAVFSDAEARMKDGAVLATNTSSILLEKLAEGLKQPQRFVGIHFFNPVAMMPLVEVVTHAALDDAVMNRALAFVNDIDKLPLPVKSAPGFLVNRALTPYLMEAFQCYDEGIKP
ncbi:MAG: 3-hydroxyacyl-CoA dehydrogenase NAD-binding domain-containing protein, partial [Hyphomicrobiales bacterium]